MIFFSKNTYGNYDKKFYDHSITTIDGKEISLKKYDNNVVLLVNTASYCGFTNQYNDLQKLHDKFSDKDFIVLGVPSNSFNQEMDNEKDIKNFCEVNFNITFPMTQIEEVIGSEKHPLYAWLKEEYGIKPKWNFHKVLFDKSGNLVDSYSALTKPKSNKLIKVIEEKIKG